MDCLSALMARANASSLTPLRLKDWQKVIQWVVGEETRYWSSSDRQFQFSEPAVPNFVLKCSPETLARIAEGKLPFFIALWGTGDIQFEGSFADAYRLGYVFCSDKRQRRVIFISHCWLNINTRFPEGAAFEGANVPLIKTLLDSGLGLIQMPCPEYECLGLEKWNYGTVVGEELRAGFRASAERVIRQIKDYRALGYEIVGVLGMNPSPSCGVGVSKGKGTMLGTSRDTSEKAESGIFIEELTALMEQEAIRDIPVFAVRRLLVGEIGIEERIEFLKSQIGV
jgi:predicted secreted protein/putative sterol carrier protein